MFSSGFSFGGSPSHPSSSSNSTSSSGNDKKRRSWKASPLDDEFKIKLVGSDNQIIIHDNNNNNNSSRSSNSSNSNDTKKPTVQSDEDLVLSSSSALLMKMGRNSSGSDLKKGVGESDEAQVGEVVITVSSPSPKTPLTSPFPNKLLSTNPKLSTSSGIESRITMPIEQIKNKASLSKDYETVEKAVEGGESIIKVMLMNGEKFFGTSKKFVFVEIASADSSRKVYSSLSETSVEYDNIIWNEELFISVSAQESIIVNLRQSDESIDHSDILSQFTIPMESLDFSQQATIEKTIELPHKLGLVQLKLVLTAFNFNAQTLEEIPIAEKPVGGVYNSRYQACGRIGQGSFGTVLKIKDLQDGTIKAMKIIESTGLDKSNQAYREATTTKLIKHDNLVEYLDIFMCKRDHNDVKDSSKQQFHICLVMPFYPKGDLFQMVETRFRAQPRKFISPTMLVEKFYEACKGLHCLHLNHVVHRDMKLRNLFFDDTFRIKIGDFGFSRSIHEGEKAHTILGSHNYTAPEIENNYDLGYSYEVDIWSLGVVFYEMITLNIRFPHALKVQLGYQTYIDEISKEVRDFYGKVDANVAESFVELLMNMLVEPRKRWTALQCLNYLKSLREKLATSSSKN